ncbi:MAG: esterase/lipase family protein [Actinomycetota bacterium]
MTVLAGGLGAGINAARAVLSPAGALGVAVEAAWAAAHLAVYPWGLAGRTSAAVAHRYRLEELAPHQRGLLIRDVEAAGTPILLVHGMADNRSVFTLLRRDLLRRGFGRVHTMNYSLLTNDVRDAARLLSAQVEEIVANSGYERIHVVGHSLGGVIARYYVQRLGGHERVHTLVTLGSPHGGTRVAHLLPTTLCRQLRAGSDLMRELAEPAPGCDTRFLCYWSDLDHLVVPQRNGRITHPELAVRNVLVRGVGHMSLPIHGRIAHEITTALSQLDPEGHTLTPGVTPLGAAQRASRRVRAPRRRAGGRPARRSTA